MSYANPELVFGSQSRALSARIPRVAIAALLVAVGYYVGARLGLALTLRPTPVSTMWPPNTILLAGLVLTPTRWWWALILAVLPAHLAIELNSGFPTSLVLAWYISNCGEALIGAGMLRALLKRPPRFDRLREVGVYIAAVSFTATFLSSFLDAAFVTLIDPAGHVYWSLWRTRFLANVMTSLVLGPAILTWSHGTIEAFRKATTRQYLEVGAVSVLIVSVSLIVFNDARTGFSTPFLVYTPLPFLLWAALRFGPRGTTASLLTISLIAIWGAVHGHGPFLTSSPSDNAVSIQMFLIVTAIPFLVLAAEIHERQHAERSARHSEEWLTLALGAADAGAWEWRIPDDFVSWSTRSRQIFGVSGSGGATLDEFLQLVHPDDREQLGSAICKAIEERSSYQSEFRVARGDQVTWVLGKGQVMFDTSGNPKRLLGVNVDITERKSAEDSRRQDTLVRQSEARLRELADAMPEIVWSATADGRPDYYNHRWYELTGATNLGNSDSSMLTIHPDDRQVVTDVWREALRTGSPCQVEHRLHVAATGEFRWFLMRAVPVHDSNGAVVRWYGSCNDIHDQKIIEQQLRDARVDLEQRVSERTTELWSAVLALRGEIADRVGVEEALRSSEERFAKAFHSSPDAIVILRQSDFHVIELNERAEEMFGYTRAEVLGKPYDDFPLLVHEEDRKLGPRLLEASGQIRELELEIRHKSGRTIHVVIVTDTVEMAGEACYIMIVRDVTQRKRSEALLIQQQRELAHLNRVAALGELSGALAHELNQPLAAILSNARAAQRMLQSDLPNAIEVREILDDIASDDRRAGEVISRLRALLKKSDLQTRLIQMNDIIKETLSLLHSDLIQRRVIVSTRLKPDLPLVSGDRVQLQQVLLNLILNACDAMAQLQPGDRRLTITADVTGNDILQVSVRDNGHGIPSEKLEQIFDAFVTTKETGLGLGLPICRSILAAHGGRLWATNNRGRGATFIMTLRVADAAVALEGPLESQFGMKRIS